jgi:hypothetical protein
MQISFQSLLLPHLAARCSISNAAFRIERPCANGANEDYDRLCANVRLFAPGHEGGLHA